MTQRDGDLEDALSGSAAQQALGWYSKGQRGKATMTKDGSAQPCCQPGLKRLACMGSTGWVGNATSLLQGPIDGVDVTLMLAVEGDKAHGSR